MLQIFDTFNYDIDKTGLVPVTEKLQKLIDKAGEGKGKVIISEGIYLTGSLFMRSGIEFHLKEGAVLLGSQKEAEYPLMQTRAAGVEMEWMGAVINAIDCDDITISGTGTIDGQGEIWWEKFWGKDRMGGMCKEYQEKGLRWAADYDCIRPRLIQFRNCKNVICKDFHLTRSGFWNLHLSYCSNAYIAGIKITNCQGPSTDGIDVDSCNGVMIEKCDISCNDDNIVIKSGMNADGMRVNRICENVEVKNCIFRQGMGLALGSDMAGGMRNIHLHDISFYGTDNGFYIKSAKTRGGIIEDIIVENLDMINVDYAINLNINWFPDFSYPKIPDDYQGDIPTRWKILTTPVPKEKGKPLVKNLTIKNLTSTYEDDYQGKSIAFYVEAYDDNPIQNITMTDVNINAKEFGSMHQIKNFNMNHVSISIKK